MVLVPMKDPKSLNNEYLDPQGLFLGYWTYDSTLVLLYLLYEAPGASSEFRVGTKATVSGVGQELQALRLQGRACRARPKSILGSRNGLRGLGFRVYGLGFRVYGLGFRV